MMSAGGAQFGTDSTRVESALVTDHSAWHGGRIVGWLREGAVSVADALLGSLVPQAQAQTNDRLQFKIRSTNTSPLGRAGNGVYEGQDAVFQIYLADNAVVPNGEIVLGWTVTGSNGFDPASDLPGRQAASGRVRIVVGQNQVEVRIRIARDSSREDLEVMIFNVRVAAYALSFPVPELVVDDPLSINVADTYPVRVSTPGIRIREGQTQNFQVEILGGMTTHRGLAVPFTLTGDGIRPPDYATPMFSAGSTRGPASYRPSRRLWRVTVPRKTDDTPVRFTIQVATVDDQEPETLENLCLELQGVVDLNPESFSRFELPRDQRRACGSIEDNDGSLRADLGAPSQTRVGEGVQVNIPVTFSAPTRANYDTDNIHPRVITYVHYQLTGGATAGLDYTVADAPGSYFSDSSGRGYLRLAPGDSQNINASAHRITLNILGDALTENAETITARITLHGHSANPNDRRQNFFHHTNPRLEANTTTTRAVTIRKNAPVTVSVSARHSQYREGRSAFFDVCANRGAGVARNQITRVTYRISGDKYLTAADYGDPGGGTLYIPAGGPDCPASAITVPITADGNHFELPETLTLTLTGASGGGDGGALVGSTGAGADTSIRQSSTIIHLGAGYDCLRKSPDGPACAPRPTDLTVEGGVWRVTVGIVDGVEVAPLIVRYTVTGIAAADYTDIGRGMLRLSENTLRGRTDNNVIAIRMTDDDITENDETATVTITSVAWEDPGQTAPLVLSDEYQTASTVVADDEVTVRVASCEVRGGQLHCGDEYGVAVEGSVAGALFRFTFYDATGQSVSLSSPSTIFYRISGDGITGGDYRDSLNGALLATPGDGSGRTHSISVTDDSLAENDETLTLTITAVQGGIAHIDADHDSAGVTILANDGLRVYVDLVDAPAQTEPASGSTTVKFRFCTAGEAITGNALDDISLLVNYALTGTAIGAATAAANPLADYRRDAPRFREIQLRRIRRVGHECIELPSNNTQQDIDILADNRNEPAETIRIAITSVPDVGDTGNVVNAQFDTTAQTYTIAASDPLTVTVAACASNDACGGTTPDEYAEGERRFFRISFNGDTVPGAAITVNYTVSGDVDLADYTDAHAGAFTIAAGTTTDAQRTLTLAVTDDTLAENAESFVVDFTRVSGGGGGEINFTPAQFAATIPANDGVQGAISAASSEVTEGAAAVFTLSVVGEVGGNEYDFTYATTGTWEGAFADADTLTTGINCATDTEDGLCAIRLSIGIPTDDIVESDETLVVTLTGLSGQDTRAEDVRLSSTAGAATVTITDATPLTVAVSALDAVVEEGGMTDFLLTFNLAAGVNLPAEVNAAYTYTGDAVTDGGGSVIIAAGSGAGVITIDIPDDNLNEADSTLTVNLGTVTGATIASGGQSAEATVADNDPIRVTIARQGAATVLESAGTVNFSVTLGGGLRTAAVIVPFSVAGAGITAGDYDISGPGTAPAASATSHTVTFGVDGSQTATDAMTIAITITDDDVNEAAEVLTVTGAAADGSGLRAGGGAIDYTAGGAASVTISASDPVTVTLAAVDASVPEGGKARFTVTLIAASAADAAVSFAAAIVSQTRTANPENNPDFTLDTPGASPLMIGAGQTSGTITIAINTDHLAEDAETLRLTVTGVTPGIGGGAVETTFPLTQDVSIPRNEALYGVDFGSAPAAIAEGASATFTVTLTGGPPFTGHIEVDWGLAPGETSAADFSGGAFPAGGTLTFTHADRALSFSIDTAADDLAEGGSDGHETFTLTLDAAASLDIARVNALGGVQLGADHDVDITDDDDLSVVIARKAGDTGAIGEDGGSATFTVSLGGATSTADVSVTFSVSEDSAGPGDYSVSASPLNLAAGQSSGEITVTGRADAYLEGDETFRVTLSQAAGGGGVAPGITTAASPRVTITDADTATVAIAHDADADGFTENGAGTAGSTSFTVTIGGGQLTDNVRVAFTVSGGHRASPKIADGLTIAPRAGMTGASGTITVIAAGDNLNEATETVTVTLTGAGGSGLTSATGSATAQLLDDDAITVTIRPPDSSPVEEGGSVNFTIAIAGGVRTTAVTVPFTVGGSGITSGDYSVTGTAVTFPAPDPDADPPFAPTAIDSMTIAVAIEDDDLNEATETLTITGADAGSGGLRVGAGGGRAAYAGDSAQSAGVEITDNDALTVTLARTAPPGGGSVDESTAVVFTVSLTDAEGNAAASAGQVQLPWSTTLAAQNNRAGQPPNSVTVPDLRSGTITPTAPGALAGVLSIDAGATSGTITITAAYDGLAEGDERFTLALQTPQPQAGAGAVALSGGAQRVSVTIGAHAATAHQVSAAAGAPVTEGGPATFTLSLSAQPGARARTTDLTVAYTLGGTAGGGASTDPARDYTNPAAQTVTFAAGQTSRTVTIRTHDDDLNEAPETVTLALGAITDALSFASIGGVGVATGTVTVTLGDNDAVTYSIADAAAVTEGASGDAAVNMRFNVELSGASAGDVTIAYTLTGSATGGVDYTSPNPRITIPAGAANNRAVITIPIIHDNLNEGPETIIVTLAGETETGFSKTAEAGAVTRASRAADYTATGTITDDDGDGPLQVNIRSTNIHVIGVGNVVYEGQDAVFQIYLAGGAVVPENSGILFGWRVTGADGFDPAADLPSRQAASGTVHIPGGQNQAEVRIRVARDTSREPSEVMVFNLNLLSHSLPNPAPAVNISSPFRLHVRDTYRASVSTAGANLSEGQTRNFQVEILGGLTTHRRLLVRFTLTGDGIRRSDYTPPVFSRGTTQVSVPYSSSQRQWQVYAPEKTDNTPVRFTIQVATVDDQEPETLENLCLELQGLADLNPESLYRLELPADQRRACGGIEDNDGTLRAALGAPSPANVGERVQVNIPVTFSAPTHTDYDTDNIHPRVITYVHYQLTGSATAGVDYTVADAPGSYFSDSSGRGYLRLAPGDSSNTNASAHRITLNILGDILTESAETITARITLHGHSANPNDRRQDLVHPTNPPLDSDATARTVTIRSNAPLTASVSSRPDPALNIATYILDSWRLEKRSEKGV